MEDTQKRKKIESISTSRHLVMKLRPKSVKSVCVSLNFFYVKKIARFEKNSKNEIKLKFFIY